MGKFDNRMKGQLMGPQYADLHMDGTTQTLITSSYPEHELNRGHIFAYSFYESLAADAHKYFFIEVPTTMPNDALYFIRWEFKFSAPFTVTYYGSPTPDDEGDAPADPAIINKNFRSQETTDLVVKVDGSIGAGSAGTVVAGSASGDSAPLGVASGGLGSETYILAPGNKFWVDAHNTDSGANIFDWNIEWWEQTPKYWEVEGIENRPT